MWWTTPATVFHKMWNQYRRTTSVEDGIKNHAETAHRKVYAEPRISSPIFWTFTDGIRILWKGCDAYYEQLIAGNCLLWATAYYNRRLIAGKAPNFLNTLRLMSSFYCKYQIRFSLTGHTWIFARSSWQLPYTHNFLSMFLFIFITHSCQSRNCRQNSSVSKRMTLKQFGIIWPTPQGVR